MDAGEGVLGQITRLWGSRGAAAQAAALAAVLISHKHADHVLGVPALLAARPSGSPPLIVIGALQSLQTSVRTPAPVSWPLLQLIPLASSLEVQSSEGSLLTTGPSTVRDWLAELAPAQRWSYVFVHCADLCRPSRHREWLLHSLGAQNNNPDKLNECLMQVNHVRLRVILVRLYWPTCLRPCEMPNLSVPP